MTNYLLVFAGALVLAIGATPAARRLAARAGFIDRPDPRRIHKRPVPRLGGAAIYLAVIVATLVLGERMEDVRAIADLSRAVWAVGRKAHGRRAQVNVSVNTFVPKPHTPFQWVGLEDVDSIREKQSLLRRELRGGGLKLSYNDPDETLLEAALARGDRRLGAVVQRAWELGARLDAWGELRDGGAWARAFEEIGLDPDFYARRERCADELFPWDVVSTGVSRGFLLKEYRRSQRGETLADCRERCHGCGILGTFGDDWSDEWRRPSPGDQVSTT